MMESSEMDTRQKIAEFNRVFGRPVNTEFQESLSDADRVLLGKLLLEETIEYCCKGLKLELTINLDMPGILIDSLNNVTIAHDSVNLINVDFNEDGSVAPMDWKEVIDGLADVNVVAHFAAHWHGFNLNFATDVVNESNMSKLGADGEPIINGLTPGYRQSDTDADGAFWCDIRDPDEPGYDSTKPMGKILKGPNFREPDFTEVKAFGNHFKSVFE